MSSLSDFDLLKKLGVEVDKRTKRSRSSLEERFIASFSEIQDFYALNGRAPIHHESLTILERRYAVRLDKIKANPECFDLLKPLDYQGILIKQEDENYKKADNLSDTDLLNLLGRAPDSSDLTELKFVRSQADRRAAEEVANRESCKDFSVFKSLFKQIKKDLSEGTATAITLQRQPSIKEKDLFILGGQMAYVAEVGEKFIHKYGDEDARLRVVFDNATESKMLLRSLQRALHKDATSRVINRNILGPLFSSEATEDDIHSGTIYVLRSESDNPIISRNRENIHKIGVTKSSVKKRIANASTDPTFLMANVKIVCSYHLFNISPKKLESLIHRIFSPARLEIKIQDRFGNKVSPMEWFLVPLDVIDEAVERIKDGSIKNLTYDPESAKLVNLKDKFA